MKLSRLFQSKSSAFRETVKTDDLPRMEKLMQKKGLSFFIEMLNADYVKDISPRMAQLFVDKLDDAVLQRWGFARDSRELALGLMLGTALNENRIDVVDAVIEKNALNMNGDKIGTALLIDVVAGGGDSGVKLRVLKAVLAGGYDKMDKPEEALQKAVEKNFTAGIDLFAAVGFDIHKNNEQYLRTAAKNKSSETGLHLVTRHGADIDLAISTEMALGNTPVFEFLAELKKQLPSNQPAPRTVESLTAEVGSLQDTVRELTQKLAKLEGGQALDKPVLRSPPPWA